MESCGRSQLPVCFPTALLPQLPRGSSSRPPQCCCAGNCTRGCTKKCTDSRITALQLPVPLCEQPRSPTSYSPAAPQPFPHASPASLCPAVRCC